MNRPSSSSSKSKSKTKKTTSSSSSSSSSTSNQQQTKSGDVMPPSFGLVLQRGVQINGSGGGTVTASVATTCELRLASQNGKLISAQCNMTTLPSVAVEDRRGRIKILPVISIKGVTFSKTGAVQHAEWPSAGLRFQSLQISKTFRDRAERLF